MYKKLNIVNNINMIYIIVLLIIILLFTRIKLKLTYNNNFNIYLLIGKIFSKKLNRKKEDKPKFRIIKIVFDLTSDLLKHITIDKIDIKLWFLIIDNPYLVFSGYMLLNTIRSKCFNEFRKVKQESFELKYNNIKHDLTVDILISMSIGRFLLLSIIKLPKILLLIKEEKKYERISNN